MVGSGLTVDVIRGMLEYSGVLHLLIFGDEADADNDAMLSASQMMGEFADCRRRGPPWWAALSQKRGSRFAGCSPRTGSTAPEYERVFSN